MADVLRCVDCDSGGVLIARHCQATLILKKKRGSFDETERYEAFSFRAAA
jgi:hypothetical protein